VRSAAVLASALAFLGAGAEPSLAADPALTRYRPVLRYDRDERWFASAIDPSTRSPVGPERVYGHRVSEAGRVWLQYWLFFRYNGQDRGVVRTGRHEGDWEFAQLRLGPGGEPDRVDLAQHSWAEGCGLARSRRRGQAPLIYVANGSHALYTRPGVADRPWPDPDDEADGKGRVARPAVTEVTAERPRWMAYRGLWGRTRAGLVPGEASSPPGPRFQEDGRFGRPGAYSAQAEACGSTPSGAAWQAVLAVAAGILLLAAVLLGARRRRRRHAT